MLWYRMESIYLTENVARAIAGHKGILAVIEKGNLEDANRTIRSHIEQSGKDILRYAFEEETELSFLIVSKTRTMDDRNQV